MPLPEPFIGILDALSVQTQARKLTWTEINKWSFLASLDQYSIKIADNGPSEDGLQYTLTILNNEGETVDDVSLFAGDEDFGKLSQLWSAARRSARGADDALRQIEEALKSL